MNDKVQNSEGTVFYAVAIGTSVIMAFVLSPTPDFVSIGLLSLLTISTSVVIGILFRRLRFLPSFKRSTIILPVVIGIVGSIVGVIGSNLIFRLLA